MVQQLQVSIQDIALIKSGVLRFSNIWIIYTTDYNYNNGQYVKTVRPCCRDSPYLKLLECRVASPLRYATPTRPHSHFTYCPI